MSAEGPIFDRRGFLRRSVAVGTVAVFAGLHAVPAYASDPPRFITVDGALNTRDIGGYAAAQGKSVAWRRVVRSANLSSVTATGTATLASLALSSVVDLRSTYSVSVNGPDVLPPGVADTFAPVGDGDAVAEAGNKLQNRVAAREAMVSAPTPAADTIAEFRSYVTSASNRAAFGKVLRLLAAPFENATLYHCNSGTFVSGWTTAVVLTALGVSRFDVNSDFLLSNQTYGSTVTFTDYLDAAFDQATQSYGTFDGYLTSGLGVDTATLAALHSSLLV